MLLPSSSKCSGRPSAKRQSTPAFKKESSEWISLFAELQANPQGAQVSSHGFQSLAQATMVLGDSSQL